MNKVLNRLSHHPGGPSLQTNGQIIYYNPIWLAKQYQQDRLLLGRKLLHCYLHCLYGHCFPESRHDTALWNFLSDLYIEILLCRFNHPNYPINPKMSEWLYYLMDANQLPYASSLEKMPQLNLVKILYHDMLYNSNLPNLNSEEMKKTGLGFFV